MVESQKWWWVVLGFAPWFAERCRKQRRFTYIWGKNILGRAKALRRACPWSVAGTAKKSVRLEHRFREGMVGDETLEVAWDDGREWCRLCRALQAVTRALDFILSEDFEQESDMILFMFSKDTFSLHLYQEGMINI